MNVKNAKIFQISAGNDAIYYGGDQGWFSSNTRAMGGCASIAAANSLRALANKNPEFRKQIKEHKNIPREVKMALCQDRPSKNSFEMLMTGVYNSIFFYELPILRHIYDRSSRDNYFFKKILHPNMGTTNTGLIRGIIRFARKFQLDISVNSLNTAFADKERARRFIEDGLAQSGAVILQTSYNRHNIDLHAGNANLDNPLTGGRCCSYTCHFVTITDIDGDRLLITTWGKPAVIDFNELAASWHSIKAFESTLLYITPSDKPLSSRCFHTAFIPFVRGIGQAVTRRSY